MDRAAMTPSPRATATLIAVAALLLPAAASAEPVVPPENSAANQYTEAIPTGGGKKDAGGSETDRSPDRVLGAKHADELRAQGADGKAAAEVAAETAPEIEVVEVNETEATPQDDSREEAVAGGGGGNGGGGSAEPRGNANLDGAVPLDSGESVVALGEADSSSGISAVLAEATGSTSSQLGALLPLLILATLAWSLAFAWRQRQQH
jgi:hypothetical protein